MACGCTSSCGCNVVAGAGLLVMRLDDTFTVSLVDIPIDPESTAPVTWSESGLRVDCCTPTICVGDEPPDPDTCDIWFDTSE